MRVYCNECSFCSLCCAFNTPGLKTLDVRHGCLFPLLTNHQVRHQSTCKWAACLQLVIRNGRLIFLCGMHGLTYFITPLGTLQTCVWGEKRCVKNHLCIPIVKSTYNQWNIPFRSILAEILEKNIKNISGHIAHSTAKY